MVYGHQTLSKALTYSAYQTQITTATTGSPVRTLWRLPVRRLPQVPVKSSSLDAVTGCHFFATGCPRSHCTVGFPFGGSDGVNSLQFLPAPSNACRAHPTECNAHPCSTTGGAYPFNAVSTLSSLWMPQEPLRSNGQTQSHKTPTKADVPLDSRQGLPSDAASSFPVGQFESRAPHLSAGRALLSDVVNCSHWMLCGPSRSSGQTPPRKC